METTAPEAEVVSKKPTAEEPPVSALMVKPDDVVVVEDKSIVPLPQDDAKALEKVPEPAEKKSSKGSLDRDIALAKLEHEKMLSFIKAWEERERSKVENKAQKRHSKVSSWENSKKASLEAQLKKIQEQLEKKKAEYAEKIKNQEALIHKQAEEKRAVVEARKGEEMLKAEEKAAKYRSTGHTPKKPFGCLFGG